MTQHLEPVHCFQQSVEFSRMYTGLYLAAAQLQWPSIAVQAWAAANHSLEETQAEMQRLQDLAEAVQNIAEPKVTFRLIQVRTSASNPFCAWVLLWCNTTAVTDLALPCCAFRVAVLRSAMLYVFNHVITSCATFWYGL